MASANANCQTLQMVRCLQSGEAAKETAQMTKRDYHLIALAIRRSTRMDDTTREAFAGDLAEELARENAKFNRALFIKACTARHPT